MTVNMYPSTMKIPGTNEEEEKKNKENPTIQKESWWKWN